MAATTVQAQAQQVQEHEYQLPEQELSQSIRDVARSSGRTIVAPADLVANRRAPALIGRFSPRDALDRLLVGSGLEAAASGSAFVIRARPFGAAAPGVAPIGPGEERIVVTGSRIRGAGPVGSAVTTLDRDDLDQGGYATAEQAVRSLPQSFGGGPGESTTGISVRADAGLNLAYGSGVNLRGLGASSTLVLLNGRRPPLGGYSGVFADLSLIPLTAVERIEVLADGSSAIYGSDAVAGVVNVIPRTRFEGVEALARTGTADGDFGEVQLAGTAGASWSGGRGMVAYEYYRRGNLEATDRPFATDDLRPFGGADYRVNYAVPGTILAGGRPFAIPAGQDGSLAPGDLVPDSVNLADHWIGADLLPEQERHAVFAAAEQELSSHVRIYAEGLYARRRFERQTRPVSLAPRLVGPDNPFYVDPVGTGEPVLVFYDFRRDLGPERQRGTVEAVGITAGIGGSLGEWSLDLHGTYGRQEESFLAENLVNSARLAAALADPDPETAFNLFGEGGANNPATVDRVRGSSSLFGRYRAWSAVAKADGPVAELPAGSARIALGAELRDEQFEGLVVDDQSAPAPVRIEDPFPGRRILAGFGELYLPLVAPTARIPGIDRLELSAAARLEDYSDFGSTLNPKLGAAWTIVPGARLRGSYGRSFRAPAFRDLQQGPGKSFYFVFPLPDPAAPGGVTTALVLRGNDPDLGPERATTWTLGIDLLPSALAGFRASATWFDVRYRDRILDPSSELFSFFEQAETYGGIIDRSPEPAEVEGYFADPAFVDLFGIPASAVDAIVDARTQNLARVDQAGLDFELGYARPLAGGTLDLSVRGTWIAHLRQAVRDTSPAVELIGTLRNPVDLRFRAGSVWSSEAGSFGFFINHVAGYENRVVVPAEPVSAWTTIDLHAALALPGPVGRSRVTLALNVSNLLDEPPPYVENFSGIAAVGFDPENANPIGRMISIQARVSW